MIIIVKTERLNNNFREVYFDNIENSNLTLQEISDVNVDILRGPNIRKYRVNITRS